MKGLGVNPFSYEHVADHSTLQHILIYDRLFFSAVECNSCTRYLHVEPNAQLCQAQSKLCWWCGSMCFFVAQERVLQLFKTMVCSSTPRLGGDSLPFWGNWHRNPKTDVYYVYVLFMDLKIKAGWGSKELTGWYQRMFVQVVLLCSFTDPTSFIIYRIYLFYQLLATPWVSENKIIDKMLHNCQNGQYWDTPSKCKDWERICQTMSDPKVLLSHGNDSKFIQCCNCFSEWPELTCPNRHARTLWKFRRIHMMICLFCDLLY